MYGVDADVTRLTFRIGSFPLGDGDASRLGVPETHCPASVCRTSSQFVNVGRIPASRSSFLPNSLYSAAGCAASTVSSAACVPGRPRPAIPHVARGEPPSCALYQTDLAFRLLLPDPPRHLRQTASRQFAQICPDCTASLFALPEILPSDQKILHDGINFRPAWPANSRAWLPLKNSPICTSVQWFLVLHAYLHSGAECPPILSPLHRFPDHPVLESSLVSGSSRIGQFSAAPPEALRLSLLPM